jgi:phosphopantetheinyl transferase
MLPTPDTPEFEAWCLRFWCAKEAVGKALGRGLPNLLRDLRVIAVDPQSGMIGVKVANTLADTYPSLTGKAIQAYTAREGDLIVASTLLGEVKN